MAKILCKLGAGLAQLPKYFPLKTCLFVCLHYLCSNKQNKQ